MKTPICSAGSSRHRIYENSEFSVDPIMKFSYHHLVLLILVIKALAFASIIVLKRGKFNRWQIPILLCIDLGAGSVKIAAFEPNDAGGLTLKAFAQQPLGLPGAQDAVREGALKKLWRLCFPTRHLRRKKSTSVPLAIRSFPNSVSFLRLRPKKLPKLFNWTPRTTFLSRLKKLSGITKSLGPPLTASWKFFW